MWLQMNEKAPFRVVEIGAGQDRWLHRDDGTGGPLAEGAAAQGCGSR